MKKLNKAFKFSSFVVFAIAIVSYITLFVIAGIFSKYFDSNLVSSFILFVAIAGVSIILGFVLQILSEVKFKERPKKEKVQKLGKRETIVLMEGDEEILKEISIVKRKMPTSRKIFIICMITYQILHFFLFFVYVNFDTIIMAFQKISYSPATYGQIVFCGFDNFSHLFSDMGQKPDLWNCIRNSLILFATNNFIILPVSIFCAYIFFKKVPLGKIYRVIFFLPNIISIVVMTMSFSFMFNGEWGPVNQLLKLVGLGGIIPANGWLGDKNTAMMMVVIYCIWAGIGYNVVFLNGAICRIPTEVIESGKLDGIGMWRELFRIVFPLILPTLSTLFINGVTVIFTIFLQPKLLTAGGPFDHITGTIAFYIVELIDNGKLYDASAVGLLFSAIGIPLVLTVKKIIEKVTPDITW